MALFQDSDVVRLRRDLPEENLSAGAEGTIVMLFPQEMYPHLPQAYEVEFCDDEGVPVTYSLTVTLLEGELEMAAQP